MRPTCFTALAPSTSRADPPWPRVDSPALDSLLCSPGPALACSSPFGSKLDPAMPAPSRAPPTLEQLRFRHGDQLHHWSVVALLPPHKEVAVFAHLILRPDGLIIDHITPGLPVPGGDIPGTSRHRWERVLTYLLPPPGAFHGTEPNLTLCVSRPGSRLAVPAPLDAGALFRPWDHFPAHRLARAPSPASCDPMASLGFPVRFWPSSRSGPPRGPPGAAVPLAASPLEDGAGGHICVPDRLAPLSAGSLLKRQPLPDDAFLDALLTITHRLDHTRRIEYSTIQAAAALGAGILPPPPDSALIGVWPPRATDRTLRSQGSLVLSLSLVGTALPHHTGFVRATLPSGWILFQRRSPALYPYVVNDMLLFARLCTGHPGPIVLVSDSLVLPEVFSLPDLAVSWDSPYVHPRASQVDGPSPSRAEPLDDAPP